jgi:hypothetical protein
MGTNRRRCWVDEHHRELADDSPDNRRSQCSRPSLGRAAGEPAGPFQNLAQRCRDSALSVDPAYSSVPEVVAIPGDSCPGGFPLPKIAPGVGLLGGHPGANEACPYSCAAGFPQQIVVAWCHAGFSASRAAVPGREVPVPLPTSGADRSPRPRTPTMTPVIDAFNSERKYQVRRRTVGPPRRAVLGSDRGPCMR